jgi:23S rRNA (adenine2030-N6)-methyltransferase
LRYRHACHAGNFADVMKHVALVATLARLTEKERPLFLLETHAGRGRYDLDSRDGAAEAARGILKLVAAPLPDTAPACIARYLGIIGSFNAGADAKPRWYPGSPLLAATLLRRQDRAAFCELLPTEAELLRREFSHDARIGVHIRDGFEALGALLPPAEKRGLALIDPPYEEQEADLARVADALADTARRWPQGVLMAWYPIKQGVVAARLHRRLLQAKVPRLLVAELCIHPDDSRAGLNGSGLVILNPPWRLDADLHGALPVLHAVLSAEGAGRVRVAMLAEE